MLLPEVELAVNAQKLPEEAIFAENETLMMFETHAVAIQPLPPTGAQNHFDK